MGLKINEFVGGFSFVNIFSLKNCFTFQIQNFKKNICQMIGWALSLIVWRKSLRGFVGTNVSWTDQMLDLGQMAGDSWFFFLWSYFQGIFKFAEIGFDAGDTWSWLLGFFYHFRIKQIQLIYSTI